MPYSPQTWIDNNASYPLSAARMTVIENGVAAASVSSSLAVTTKTAAYTAVAADDVILGDATTAGFTVTLPTAVGNTGLLFIVKKIDSTVNVVTVGTTSSQTIDGYTTLLLDGQYDAYTIASDGANWVIV